MVRIINLLICLNNYEYLNNFDFLIIRILLNFNQYLKINFLISYEYFIDIFIY